MGGGSSWVSFKTTKKGEALNKKKLIHLRGPTRQETQQHGLRWQRSHCSAPAPGGNSSSGHGLFKIQIG